MVVAETRDLNVGGAAVEVSMPVAVFELDAIATLAAVAENAAPVDNVAPGVFGCHAILVVIDEARIRCSVAVMDAANVITATMRKSMNVRNAML